MESKSLQADRPHCPRNTYLGRRLARRFYITHQMLSPALPTQDALPHFPQFVMTSTAINLQIRQNDSLCCQICPSGSPTASCSQFSHVVSVTIGEASGQKQGQS
ncbi:hypothetical protein VFPPC_16557 [Pochonia chlamydosporia 170]|uniref:Uncharacterized protein n=1 Tax=Pochonia chlamydosporia 170 TaxID=1380566 RepID=A0A179F8N5_METCM|nr:hypothetical protein VFPPC_16557 [Pochonia chlamydosporia 170]OAQ61792.1 hypothetical protein VFPPC_16557 [Pochonia chlamydosporia 170]